MRNHFLSDIKLWSSTSVLGRLLPIRATQCAGQVRCERLAKSNANEWASAMQMGGAGGGQQGGVGTIWKGSMRAHIQPPKKTGVTGVTSVTPFTKCPFSLAFMPVTQLSDIAYPRCNAAPACNAKVSIRVLWAGALRSSLPSEFRGLRLSMRGNHAGDPESFSFTRGMKPVGLQNR